MLRIDDKYMNFRAGWIVETKDDQMIYEGDMTWEQVKKKNIKTLYMKWQEKLWSVSGKENYIQFKRGFVLFSPSGGMSEDSILSERCIGYYDEFGRKVIYRINELTGQMRFEIKEG